jgi:predicted Zn-dependent protease
MMEHSVQREMINEIGHSLDIQLNENILLDQLRARMIVRINELIQKDFNALVLVLYRVDVSEAKLKYFLKTNKDHDAASIIADLVIERQLQKIETRKKFSQENRDIPEDEKW